jgi:hypothetical protein
MKVIKVLFPDYMQATDVPENDEESAQVQFVVLLEERGVAGFIDRKVCLVVIRDGKLVLV